MKKHFFNVIAALALVCGVFAFTGCADYESDINSLNERLDELETGQIASIEDQIAALTGSLDEAEELIKMLQGNVSDLEAADDAMGQQIDAINGEIENVKADITDLGGQIADINGKISDVQNELSKKIDDAVAELEAADDYNADKIAALTQDLSDAKAPAAKVFLTLLYLSLSLSSQPVLPSRLIVPRK